MKPRTWQAECVNLAMRQYQTSDNHFLALATPGAGKTYMASDLTARLFKADKIDLVFCFSPSNIVAQDFCQVLQDKTNERFDGRLGSKGHSLTYQSMQYLDDNFWSLFDKFRILVIFDEIHHCSGSNIENSNSWGEQIILNIQDKATYTLALTGTPWRSDTAPIVLSTYTASNSKIVCDYLYGLAEAIRDKVCRMPQIIAIDNDNISVTEQSETKQFYSFDELFSQSTFPYQKIIEDEKVIIHLLQQANEKLNALRQFNPDAGGLIVASSVEHAQQIANLLHHSIKEKAMIVTYREDEPSKLIKQFRQGTDKWIISVGMISEGTNIPRLQVCCHLTNIKTEMHFRQILGRILRMTGSVNQEAILYMPAEPKLVEYAYRVGQDIPSEVDIVTFKKMTDNNIADNNTINASSMETEVQNRPFNSIKQDIDMSELWADLESIESHLTQADFSTGSYEKMIDIFGRFKQETLAHSLIPLE